MTQQNCQSKSENCYYDNVEQSWIPVMWIFVSRVIRKDRDEQFVYNGGRSSFASRPSGTTLPGDYSWRSGSGKKSLTLQAAYHQKSVDRFARRLWSILQRRGHGEAPSCCDTTFLCDGIWTNHH